MILKSRSLVFFLVGLFLTVGSFSAFANSQVKTYSCVDDQRPRDGALREIILSLNADSTYDLTWHVAHESPKPPEFGHVDKRTVVAHGLECQFSTSNAWAATCSRDRRQDEKTNTYLTMVHRTESGIDFMSGKEFNNQTLQIDMNSAEPDMSFTSDLGEQEFPLKGCKKTY